MHKQTLPALILLLICPTAGAVEYTGLDFSLQLSQTDLQLRYNDIDHNANVERVEVVAFETTDPYLQYGFIAGSSRLTLDSDPLLAGLNLDGYHAGLALRGGFGQTLHLDLLGQYLYQDVKDSSVDRDVNITWHEWRAETLASLHLGSPLTVVAGLAYVNVDAQERITGNGALTRNIPEEAGTEKLLGLELNVENYSQNSGRVGLHIQRGVYDRISLIFARRF